MRGWLYIVLLLISPQVFAGVFDPPPTDKSVSLLGMIFGANVGDIPLGGSPNSVLAAIMEKFNFIIVVAGTVVVSYVAILSTINTAQEGTAMGKKWSAVWIPMRSVAGMALMIPTPASGYSMIQITVLWIVIQGIGAADQLWNIALQGLLSGVSASSGSIPINPSIANAGTDLAAKILNATICMETIYKASTEPTNVNLSQWAALYGQYVKDYNVQSQAPTCTDLSCTATASGVVNFGLNDPSPLNNAADVCGKLSVVANVTSSDYPNGTTDDLVKLAQNAYDIKIQTIALMIDELAPLAKMLVNDADSDPSQRPVIGSTSPPNPSGYLAAAANAYVESVSQLIQPGGATNSQALNVFGQPLDPLNVGGANITDNTANTAKVVQAGIDNGWVDAGSSYFNFNKTRVPKYLKTATNDAITDSTSGSPVPTLPKTDYNPDITNAYSLTPLPDSDPNMTALNTKFSLGVLTDADRAMMARYLAYGYVYGVNDIKASGISGGSAFSSSSTTQDAISGMVGGQNAVIMNDLTNLMEGSNPDPLMAHAIFGRNLMIGTEATLSLLLLIAGVTFVASGVSVLGTGDGAGFALFMMTVLAIVFGYLGALWAFGATLAIYAPFIPFMIFDLTALGWMLTVVEAIIAAPIIALGLVMPSGDEMGKLSHALMLLANIFLRPMLMIFGFLLAGGVYKAIVNLIDFGMADVLQSVQVNTMFSSLAIIAVYTTFILSVTNQAFSLIHAVPDKILRWLGVSGESTNVSAVGDVKQASSASNKAIGAETGRQVAGATNALGQFAARGEKKGANADGGDSTPPAAGGGH